MQKCLLISINPSNTLANEYVEQITIPISYVTYKYALKFVFKIVSEVLTNWKIDEAAFSVHIKYL